MIKVEWFDKDGYWIEIGRPEAYRDNQREQATSDMKNHVANNGGKGRVVDKFGNTLAVAP